MDNMKVSPENAKKVMELAAELANEQDLVASIQKRTAVNDAAKVAADLTAGIANFDETYEKTVEGGVKPVIAAKIGDALEGRTDEEKTAALSGIIKALGGEPEDIPAGKLQEAAVDYIDEYALMNIDLGGGAAEALSALGENTSAEVGDLALQSGARQYVAAAVFILREQGTLPEVNRELDAETIGVYTAATVLSDQIIREGAAGKIPWGKVKAVLKVIAAVVVTLILANIIMHTAVIIAVEIAITFGLYFLSFGALHTLVTLGLVSLAMGLITGTLAIAGMVKEFVTPGLAVITGLWLKAAEWVKTEVVPMAKAFWQTIKERAAAFAGITKEKATAFAETAKEKATEFAETAKEKATEFAETAKEKAAEMAETEEEEAEVPLTAKNTTLA